MTGRVLLWRSDPHGDRFFALRTFRRDGSGRAVGFEIEALWPGPS